MLGKIKVNKKEENDWSYEMDQEEFGKMSFKQQVQYIVHQMQPPKSVQFNSCLHVSTLQSKDSLVQGSAIIGLTGLTLTTQEQQPSNAYNSAIYPTRNTLGLQGAITNDFYVQKIQALINIQPNYEYKQDGGNPTKILTQPIFGFRVITFKQKCDISKIETGIQSTLSLQRNSGFGFPQTFLQQIKPQFHTMFTLIEDKIYQVFNSSPSTGFATQQEGNQFTNTNHPPNVNFQIEIPVESRVWWTNGMTDETPGITYPQGFPPMQKTYALILPCIGNTVSSISLLNTYYDTEDYTNIEYQISINSITHFKDI